jgi:hypothetical protein
MLSAYCAAKAGVVGMVRGLALELRGTGVTANAVSPGSTRTPMLEESARLYGLAGAEAFAAQQLIERLIDPDEVAALIAWVAGAGTGAVTGAPSCASTEVCRCEHAAPGALDGKRAAARGLRGALDCDVERSAGGALTGGTPGRVVRLSPARWRAVEAFEQGESTPSQARSNSDAGCSMPGCCVRGLPRRSARQTSASLFRFARGGPSRANARVPGGRGSPDRRR